MLDEPRPPGGHPAPQGDLERWVSLLRATLDATDDGILVVDREGRIVTYNERFVAIWDLPAGSLDARDDARALAQATERVRDPDAFLRRVRDLYAAPDETSFDVIHLVDGRVLERYSRPQRLGDEIVGRVWSFRDVTVRDRAERALAASEERYRRLFLDSKQPVYVTSAEGRILDVNAAFLALFGYERAEVEGLDAEAFYADPAERAAFRQAIEAAGFVEDWEARLRTRDGRVLDCRLTTTLRRDDEGRVVAYQGIVEDVTDQTPAEREMRASERYFRSLIENAGDTITIIDADGIIVYESPSVERVLGYRVEELVGRTIFDFIHPGDVPAAMRQLGNLLTAPGTTLSVEARFRHREGGWRTMEAVSQNLLDDGDVGGIVINGRDVTERKAAEARLVHDAFHDRLTGLPNRALLMDRLSQMVLADQRRAPAPFAVLFLDMDRFKVVNDSLGHMVGDQLLMALARRLEALLRPRDTVARLGGDEFTMLLDGATEDEAMAVAERVQADLEAPIRLGGHELYTTVSIGLATSERGYGSAEDMIRDADLAMYRAKEQGRSGIQLFDESMHRSAVALLELETDLRRAVAREEFVLHFQPIVRLADDGLYGYEVLLRWAHPERGILPPSEFLRTLEETGLIVPVGWWVIEEVCRTVAAWHREPKGSPPVFQVNMSAHQLSQSDLIPRLRSILDATGAPPARLHLELTEGTLMENAESTVMTLGRLKDLGIGLSIDDFGTGYSSLSYLHRFPTDSVKIDRSFVHDMGYMGRVTKVVRTIVDLAHHLGLAVVAEGIETPAQAATLRGMGCEYGQGFLYAEPGPLEAVHGLSLER